MLFDIFLHKLWTEQVHLDQLYDVKYEMHPEVFQTNPMLLTLIAGALLNPSMLDKISRAISGLICIKAKATTKAKALRKILTLASRAWVTKFVAI
ncbi:hypothetical protein TNIN_299581 [Trichonephila inaurata madagascariensis]|uniref:Uncharacterized protein n=1 Tax=Trichonephila inaurata madagascariensis TaxID=2747483 RepID=A0A8X7BXJ6_9ARAC|nr:hypothetical protein TNIN_299581 [Trichonephila inaurata madagascariensis]